MRQTRRRSKADLPTFGNTLDEPVRAYIAHRLEGGDLRPGTAKCNLSVLLRFSSVYGRRPLSQFGEAAVRAWRKSTLEGYAASTATTHMAVVRPFLVWLAEEWTYTVEVTGPDGEVKRQTKRVPNVRSKVGRAPDYDRDPRALGRDQVRALLEVLPDRRAHAMVALMLWPGLRCCELTRMRLTDYDGENLRVRGKGAHHVRKGEREYPEVTRTVPVGPQARAAVEAWLDERGRHPGPMFPNRHGDEGLKAGWVSTLVGEWMRAAGIKAENYDGKSAHALRHTAATDALNDKGENIVAVQELLGHKHLGTTRVYLKVSRQHLAGCVDRPAYREAPVPALTLLPPPTGAPVDLPPPMPMPIAGA